MSDPTTSDEATRARVRAALGLTGLAPLDAIAEACGVDARTVRRWLRQWNMRPVYVGRVAFGNLEAIREKIHTP